MPVGWRGGRAASSSSMLKGLPCSNKKSPLVEGWAEPDHGLVKRGERGGCEGEGEDERKEKGREEKEKQYNNALHVQSHTHTHTHTSPPPSLTSSAVGWR